MDLAGAYDISREAMGEMTFARIMRIIDLKEERHHRAMKYRAYWSLLIASSMASHKLNVDDDLYPPGKGVSW